MTHDSAKPYGIGKRAIGLILSVLMILSVIPLVAFPAAASSSEKPWEIYGYSSSGAETSISTTAFIAHLPYYAQASQLGNSYSFFVAKNTFDNGTSTNSDPTNFGSTFVAAKPMYAFLQGHSYSTSAQSPYVQDTNNNMTITGNTFVSGTSLTGSNATGTISTTSAYPAIKMSAGTLKLHNVVLSSTSGVGLDLSGGTISSITGTFGLTSASNEGIYMHGGNITTLSPTGTIAGGTNGNAIFMPSGSGSTIGSIASGTYTSSGANSAVHIQAGNTVTTISGGTFRPGTTAYYGVQNLGTIGSVTGGTFYGFHSTGTVTNGITGGTFDFREYTASTFDDIKDLIGASYIAKLDSSTGNGKFTVVLNSGVDEGIYIGKAPSGVEYTTGTFGSYTTYTVGSGGVQEPDPEPEPDPITLDSDYYVIINKASGKVLNIPFAAMNSNSTSITVYDPDNTPQQCVSIATSGNYVSLAPMNCSSRAVTIASATANAAVTLSAKTNANAQLFTMERAGSGYIFRSALNDDFVLAETGAYNGAPIAMKAYDVVDSAQIWTLAPVTFDSDTLSGIANITSASGYSAVSGPLYTIAGGATMTFAMNMTSTTFNKYHISYYSNRPVSGTITYNKSGTSVTERFYLESATTSNLKTFDGLIDTYLSNGNGNYITSISITAKTGNDTGFALYGVTTERYEVYAETVYIENTYLKVGALLTMGGGISYIENKQDGNSSISNLLNRHDVGRLVQQSYYAGNAYANDGYTPGTYNSQLWGYNPVQGGSTNGNKSKIVDVIVTDDRIYVKCMPRDWATGNFAQSYMEDTYTLNGSSLEVDNRFFDWSGYQMNTVDQEMPAFYVISYLSDFTWYSGSSPWTNAATTTETSLPFWGQVTNGVEVNSAVCRHYPWAAAETWCAWTKNGVGIGIYTPGASQLFAGRYSYNGSTSSTNAATNYVAPLRTTALTNYSAFTYNYMITTGSLSTIRSTFAANQTITSDDFVQANIPATASVGAGEQTQLSTVISPVNAGDKTLTWTSSDSSVATVENGLVSGIKQGTAVITAITSTGESTSCTVTVTKSTATTYYSVTLTNSKDTTQSTVQTIASGTTITLPTVTAAGFVQKNWYCMTDKASYAVGTSYTVTGDVQFIATWTTLTSYTVTYDKNGGTGTADNVTVTTGTGITMPASLSKPNYVFLGWRSSLDNTVYDAYAPYTVTGNVTFTAVFSPYTYDISFNANGHGTAPSTVSGAYGSSITLPSLSATGYTFNGWSDGTTTYAGGASYTINAELTLVAQWTAKSYVVTYVDDTTSTVNANYNTAITLPTPEKSGYTFDGWSDGTTTYAGGASYTVTGAVTFTAQWTQNAPVEPTATTVQFGKGIRLGATINLNIIVNGMANAPTPIPATATDVKATLWYLDENGEKAGIVESNVTLGTATTISYDKLPAYALQTLVYAQVTYTDNGVDYISQEYSTSSAAYCTAQLAKTTLGSNLRRLMVDLLNYGSAAQIYFASDVDNLANKDIDAYQNEASAANPAMTDVAAIAGTGLPVGASLSLKSRVEVKFQIPKAALTAAGLTLTSENSYLRVTRRDTGAYVDVALSGEEEIAYNFYYAGLSAFEFDVTVDAVLYIDGAAVSKTRTYSINSYLTKNVANADANLASLCTMLSRYGAAAKVYVNAPNA